MLDDLGGLQESYRPGWQDLSYHVLVGGKL